MKTSTFRNKCDLFRSSPHLTVDGQKSVGTNLGLLSSILFSILMVWFSSRQIFAVVRRENPAISQHQTQYAFTNSEETLPTDDFFFAFTV